MTTAPYSSLLAHNMHSFQILLQFLKNSVDHGQLDSSYSTLFFVHNGTGLKPPLKNRQDECLKAIC